MTVNSFINKNDRSLHYKNVLLLEQNISGRCIEF